METGGPDRPDMEVLDTDRPPSRFGAWIGAALRRRGVRLLGLGLALVLVGVWFVSAPSENPVTGAAGGDKASAPITAPGLRPPPARGRTPETGSGSWQVLDDLAIRTGPRGHQITFSAINRGPVGQDPSDLEVVGSFVDAPGLAYRATCAAVGRATHGTRPLIGAVESRERVYVRCTDVTRYRGTTAWIDPTSVEVRVVPCESEASAVPM